MWCLYRGPLLVLIAASLAKEKMRKVQWCDLYGRVPGEGNRTTVVFQNLRSQFDKDFYRDMSCIMKSATFIELPTSNILPRTGAPCHDIVSSVKLNTELSSPTAIMLMGPPLCDIQATSTALNGVKNLDRLSFWKISACVNCTFSTIPFNTAEGISVHLIAMPAVLLSHLVPHTDSVHALANELTGTPVSDRVTGLYIPITPPKELSLRFSPWEKGGHIAALVTLIFMFFVMALFACCCAFTQSALIIEDYNHRDEMQLIWRLQENEQFNEANFPPDPDNLSMHSEATQASAEAESEHALL